MKIDKLKSLRRLATKTMKKAIAMNNHFCMFPSDVICIIYLDLTLDIDLELKDKK